MQVKKCSYIRTIPNDATGGKTGKGIIMTDEFKPINTQEELNAVIADRIKRAEEKAKEPFADYDDIKKQKEAYEQTITDLNAKIKNYESDNDKNGTTLKELQDKVAKYEKQAVKIRVAHEVGLPFDLAERLNGDDEDAIKKDAENIVKYLAPKAEAPLGEPEPLQSDMDDEDKALMGVIKSLER